MMFSFLLEMKTKMMVSEAFVLFFPVTLEINGGSYTIAPKCCSKMMYVLCHKELFHCAIFNNSIKSKSKNHPAKRKYP